MVYEEIELLTDLRVYIFKYVFYTKDIFNLCLQGDLTFITLTKLSI